MTSATGGVCGRCEAAGGVCGRGEAAGGVCVCRSEEGSSAAESMSGMVSVSDASPLEIGDGI